MEGNLIEKKQEYKYTDTDVDRIVRQKLERWKKKNKAEITDFEQHKKTLSSYKRAVSIFLTHGLPFDADVMDCVVHQSLAITEKNAQAIVNYIASIGNQKSSLLK